MDWTSIIGVVMGTLSTIVCAWFTYNQYGKNKEIDHKIARREREDKEKRDADKVASQNIYRELWALLNKLQALRVYIVQPHPLDRAKYISIQYEVLSEGMISVMPIVHRLPVGHLPGFVAELESNEYVYWHSQSEVMDGRARSIMHTIGSDKMVAVRMMTNKVWRGNIVADFDNTNINEEEVRNALNDARTIIQYMLPEIEED